MLARRNMVNWSPDVNEYLVNLSSNLYASSTKHHFRYLGSTVHDYD